MRNTHGRISYAARAGMALIAASCFASAQDERTMAPAQLAPRPQVAVAKPDTSRLVHLHYEQTGVLTHLAARERLVVTGSSTAGRVDELAEGRSQTDLATNRIE